MKYIRTKEGIGRGGNDLKKYDWVGDIQVLDVADTIEELCDEFVCVSYKNKIYDNLHNAIAYKNGGPYITKNIFGAIWTDKGLIYVAKMNKEGELELL